MSNGEIAYLALVLTTFFVFIGVVGFVSIWSRIPRKMDNLGPQRAATAPVDDQQQSDRSKALDGRAAPNARHAA